MQLEIFRLYNHEDLRIEKFGDRLIISIYSPNLKVEALHQQIGSLPFTCFAYRLMFNRGANPHQSAERTLDAAGLDVQPPANWLSQEGGAKYLLKLDQGKSYGIFVDQRENRKRIQDLSQNKKVLNLFCYTGGFSVSALLGGCAHVDSIDTSQKTLDWLSENLELNDFDNKKSNVFKMDALEYLRHCHRKNKTYDIVVLDPPSFSRGKSKVFRLEKDWLELANAVCKIINPDGLFLFSCNLEKWSDRVFQSQMNSWNDTRFKKVTFPDPAWDTRSKPSTMKSVIFSGKTHD